MIMSITSIPGQISERLSSDEEILYQFEKPSKSKTSGLVFTNSRLVYYKAKPSGEELLEYSWRDVDKIKIEEGLLNGEIEFEMKGDHEIELEDIPMRDVRKMYALATELKEMAHASRTKADFAGRASRSVPLQLIRGPGQRSADMGFLARIWALIQARINRIMGIEDTRDALDLSYEKQLNLLANVRGCVADFAASKGGLYLGRRNCNWA
jgi:Bacterial PH domain